MNPSLLCFALLAEVLIAGNYVPNSDLPKTSFVSMLDSVSGNDVENNNSEFLESNDILEIGLNENNFRIGEAVVITVKNSGVETLTFPDAALGLLIENTVTKERFGIIAAQVLTSLKPGESKRINWDQRGLDGTQANTGKYKISVSTVPDEKLFSLTTSTYFQIN